MPHSEKNGGDDSPVLGDFYYFTIFLENMYDVSRAFSWNKVAGIWRETENGVGGVMALKVTGVVTITEITQKTSGLPSQISLQEALAQL